GRRWQAPGPELPPQGCAGRFGARRVALTSPAPTATTFAMAAGTTIHHLLVNVSDVDRGVYEALDLRVARHPSETMRWLLTRTLAYCLSHGEGIAFSKGGLSDTDGPPLAVHDATGKLLAWIEIGAPSADRLHKAAKAAPRVALFTTS